MEGKSDKTDNGSLRRVFLVDDHPMLIDGLSRLVNQIPGCEVCGQAATAAEAFAEIPSALPDLVIMDLSLPDRNGLELIREFHSIVPEVRILTFSMHDEMLYAVRTIKAGGKGYLMKGADTTLLIAAISRVLDGGIYLSPQVSDHLLQNPAGADLLQIRLQALSDRELEIFELVGHCRSVSQISEQLNISPKTVNAQCGAIGAKLDLPDEASLMQEAILWVELTKEPDSDAGAEDNAI